MASVQPTKTEFLKGIVEENLHVRRDVRRMQRVKTKQRFRPWMLGVVLIGIVSYMTIPSPVISRGTPASNQAVLTSATASPRAIEQTPEATAPLSNPHGINREVLPLAIKRIVVDPGHGGEPGALSESGVTEKAITLDVALRMRRLLANGPFEVLLTRETDRLVSLERRVAFANENRADLFVSVHVNWMESRTIRGLETFYVGPSDDPATLKLASRENKESGYALSDYKQILEKIYLDSRRDESRMLAKSIQTELFNGLKPVNLVLANRGVKTAPFVVLVGTQMPAILAEVSCVSNEDEVNLLTKEEYRENIAKALIKGVRAYASTLNSSDKKGNY